MLSMEYLGGEIRRRPRYWERAMSVLYTTIKRKETPSLMAHVRDVFAICCEGVQFTIEDVLEIDSVSCILCLLEMPFWNASLLESYWPVS